MNSIAFVIEKKAQSRAKRGNEVFGGGGLISVLKIEKESLCWCR